MALRTLVVASLSRLAFRRLAAFAAGLLICLLAAAGCSSSAERFADVTGTVTIEGKPAAGVLVTFEPQMPDPRKVPVCSFGTTNADGQFRLMRRANLSGAVLGQHHVRITPVEQEGGKLTAVHPRYQANNALWAEVADGPNVIDFELRTDPTKASAARAEE